MAELGGYHPGTNVFAFDTLSSADTLNQRAFATMKMTEHGWGYRMNARLGRVTATSPLVKLSVWSYDGDPDELMETTSTFSVGTAMDSVSTGTNYQRDLLNAIKLQSGKRYALGFNANGARLAYGYAPKENIRTGEVYDVWQKTVASGPTPQDPFQASSIRNDYGWLAIWLEYMPNVAPNTPSSRTPSNGAFVAGTKPTFQATFSDNNQTLPNGETDGADSLNKFKIMVRNSSGVEIWNSGVVPATFAQQTASAISYYWDNTLLNDGETYSWAIQMWDQFDASTTSPYNTFTVGSGYIDISASTPTGRQTSRTPSPWTGVWHNSFGATLTNVRIQIMNKDTGSIIRETADISVGTPKTNGQSFSLTWASLGLTQLPLGTNLAWRAMGKTNGGTYTNYTSYRDFQINYAPNIPRIYTPGTLDGSTVSSSRPLITAASWDEDQLPGSGWQMYVRISDVNGTPLFTRAMNYQAAMSSTDDKYAVFSYQTTATDMPSAGTYQLQVYAHDGSVYSGGSATLDENAYSPITTFQYIVGPVVTNVSPADGAVIGTDQPRYDFSVPGTIIKYQVRVYEGGTVPAILVYDSREVTTSQEFHDQPGGYLENHTNYYRVIDVWDTTNTRGVSDAFNFMVEFGAAHDLTGFVASPHRVHNDITPTAVLMSWDQSDYDTTDFDRYIIMRRADDETLFEVDDAQGAVNRRIGEITSKSQTTFVDYLPASGVTYTYSIKQRVREGGAWVTSDTLRQEAMVNFKETVFCDARHGGARRAVLPYRETRDIPREFDREARRPWGSRAPMYRKTKRFNRKITADYYVSPESGMDIGEIINGIDEMAYYGGPICYRDGRGRRYFGEIEEYTEKDPQGGRPRSVSITFGQSNALEEEDID